MSSSRIRVALCLMAVAIGGFALPSEALAQHHHRGHVVVVGGGFYPYYSPFYWGAFYGSPFWGPYWGPYAWPYAPYPAYDYSSEIRVMATPREAEVYVDGYLVGIVDDFDGWSQRLRVQPGEHEIELFLEGYKSVRQRSLFRPGESYKIRAVLEKTDPGDPPPVRPVPVPSAAPGPNAGSAPPPQPAMPSQPAAPASAAGFGTLAVRVQPADALVVVDGERWDRPAGETRVTLELSEGRHDVEISKDGFTSYMAVVHVKAGEVTTLNVSLPVKQ